MGRPSKPWWWDARKCWAATVGGVRHTEKSGLGPRDEHAAWAWHAALMEGVQPVRASVPGLAELCERYLAWDAARVASGEREPRSHAGQCYRLTRLCRSLLGGIPAGSVPAESLRPGHVEELMRAWAAEGLGPIYVRQLAMDAKKVTRWASRPQGGSDPLLASDPLEWARVPALPASPERFASRAEAAAWLRWLWRRGLRDFAHLQRCLIYTGARPKELATATWGDVRWRAQRNAAGHWLSVIVLGRWKAARTTGRLRRVFLPARLTRSLLRRFGAVSDLDTPVWTTPRGNAWGQSNLATYTGRLRDLAIAEGLPFEADGPNRLVNYRWRHTAASMLIMDGVPLSSVAELLGTSAKVLARTYAHLLQEHLGDAAERMSGAGKRTRPAR